MTAGVICAADRVCGLDSSESLATSFPNNLTDAHWRQAVKTTNSGAYTAVMIRWTLQKKLWGDSRPLEAHSDGVQTKNKELGLERRKEEVILSL